MSEVEDITKNTDEEQEEPGDIEQDEEEEDEEAVEIEQDDDDDDDDDEASNEAEAVIGTKIKQMQIQTIHCCLKMMIWKIVTKKIMNTMKTCLNVLTKINNVIPIYMHESKIINKEELDILTKVIRNDDGFITDNLHTTIPWLSKYEFSKLLGQRIKQLNEGNKPYINIDNTSNIDNYNIAEQEINV